MITFNLLHLNYNTYKNSVSSNLSNMGSQRADVGVKFCGNSLPPLTIVTI
ncbi:hypothetical protein [Methylomonas albis]|nr:hypothetical protein [Methylomonas albis]